jgi:hypothetical protein
MPAASAAARSCRDVVNPYEGTRYEGVDLSRIRAVGVGCEKARIVARRAHRKALKQVPNVNGLLRFGWHGWRVEGDLRPDSDRYVAKRKGERVRWRF